MKTTRTATGCYTVKLHSHSFKLEKLFGDSCWRLYNSSDTEVNCSSTKAALLEVMSSWTQDHADKYATADTCSYA